MKKRQYKIELSDEAEADFDNSYEYYANQSIKLADSFYHYINDCLLQIGRNPIAYQTIFKEIRKFVVKKFPFVVYYQIIEMKVRVIAIFHNSRNPIIWQERT
jgi:plasmid stabilization system protein ParE